MHDTALEFGKLFLETYACGPEKKTIVEIGARDVNGSLRQFAATHHDYIGLDFDSGRGVDVVIEDPYCFPLETESADIVLTSSCFEHSEFFWLTFLDCQRILKPGGVMYLNAPSNGLFHRHPVDCWRFYPDSGLALARWANRNGFKTLLLESFTGRRRRDVWNDFIAVFIKDPAFAHLYPARIIDCYTQGTNVLRHPEYKPGNYRLHAQRALYGFAESFRALGDAVVGLARSLAGR
jgi:SAM-dependent methyltransferase